jgi:hypothetical protein
VGSLVKSLTPSLSQDQSISIESIVEKDGHKREFCYKRKREARMAKEWANKDKYHHSHGVPKPCIPLPKGKGFVRKVPAWGENGALRERDPAREVKPVRPVWKPVRPILRQQSDLAGFRARNESRFGSGGRGSSGWSGEFAGGQFARRSPPRDEFGRGSSFESQRGYGPRSPSRGSRTPPVRQEWFSHGSSRFGRFDRMDHSFDRHCRMDVANPTFEEIAQH